VRDSGFAAQQVSRHGLRRGERIARHLDMALFDSVLAAEVRALASSGSFEKLFDMFSQFLSQVISYRWMALVMDNPRQVALHHREQPPRLGPPVFRPAIFAD